MQLKTPKLIHHVDILCQINLNADLLVKIITHRYKKVKIEAVIQHSKIILYQ
jgi:hypothetical protein